MNKLRTMPLFLSAMVIMLLGGLLLLALPKATYSELENRVLSQWSDVQPLTDGFDERVETYLSDHFPGRGLLVRLQATLQGVLGQRQQDNALLGRNSRLFEIPPQEISRVARTSVATLQEVQEVLKLPLSLMLLPTSSQYLQDQLPALYQPVNQQALIDQLYALAGDVTCLDAALAQVEEPDRLYYRTDHHLTAEGAYEVYTRLAYAWGLTPQKPSLYELPGFLGSYYGRIPALTVQPETFSVYLPDGLTLTLDGQEQPSLIHPMLAQGRNKYAALLGRPAREDNAGSPDALLSRAYGHAVLIGGGESGSLLLLSDSYGNAVAPLLAQHFARIDIIDARYFSGTLSQVVSEGQTDHILALFGLNSFNVNSSLALLNITEEE